MDVNERDIFPFRLTVFPYAHADFCFIFLQKQYALLRLETSLFRHYLQSNAGSLDRKT